MVLTRQTVNLIVLAVAMKSFPVCQVAVFLQAGNVMANMIVPLRRMKLPVEQYVSLEIFYAGRENAFHHCSYVMEGLTAVREKIRLVLLVNDQPI